MASTWHSLRTHGFGGTSSHKRDPAPREMPCWKHHVEKSHRDRISPRAQLLRPHWRSVTSPDSRHMILKLHCDSGSSCHITEMNSTPPAPEPGYCFMPLKVGWLWGPFAFFSSNSMLSGIKAFPRSLQTSGRTEWIIYPLGFCVLTCCLCPVPH